MTNLDRKSQKFKAENDFVKHKHLEGIYLACLLRSTWLKVIREDDEG